MPSIFISYRRADAGGHALNLHHRLAGWFDDGTELFFDGQNIDSGHDFPQRLRQAVDDASVVLVLMGPGWLEEINRRAKLPGLDFVRVEVEQVLQRAAGGQPVRVLPVLLGGAAMPSAHCLAPELQASLGPLLNLDAHVFTAGKLDDWEHQFQRLRRLLAGVPEGPRERYRDRSGQPRPWRVIDHALSPHFQDPNDLLGALRHQLQGSNGMARGPAAIVGAGGAAAAALHGMGGIGKTQLALAYCHRWRESYAGIWWLRAETAGGYASDVDGRTEMATSRSGSNPGGDSGISSNASSESVQPAPVGDTLLQQDALAACAAAGVAVPEGRPPSAALVQWLRGQSAPWLLVFDNADHPASLRQHLPGPGPHHVLITSRRPDWGGLAKAVELHTWTPAQGALFLQQRLGDGPAPKAEAEALVQALGGLPLALEQAASYIETNGGSAASYLGLWQTAADGLLQRHSTSTGYERTVAATLSLALPLLSAAAQQLLRLCACAAPEPLPERFLVEGAEHPPAELAAAAANPLEWNEVVGELRRYALAQRDAIPSLDRAWQAGGIAPTGTPNEQALRLHRLTQRVVGEQLAAPDKVDARFLAVLDNASRGDIQNPALWPRLAHLFPHVVWQNVLDPIAPTWKPDMFRVKTRLLMSIPD